MQTNLTETSISSILYLIIEIIVIDIMLTFIYPFTNRRGPGQSYLKRTLQELVERTNETGNNEDLNLEVNPVKVYCALHSVVDDERNNITMERALKDKSVKEKIRERLVKLTSITTHFFDAIINSLDQVPYGIRWLCKAIYQLCQVRMF